MARVRIATFNVENLFARYRFRESFQPRDDAGFGMNDMAFSIQDEDAKRLTAKAIRETDADVICLQEIENLTVLERFNSRMLGGMGYRHRILVDSHDPRFIDVAVLSRYPFVHVNTHRNERNAANTTWLFSRDCLEVDVSVNGATLSLYVNHLKSMMDRQAGAADGRETTRDRRVEQARAVKGIVDGWWRPLDYAGNFIVLGDLNDYPQDNTSLGALLNHPHLVNVLDRLPATQRWTHFWAGGGEYRQLDYLLLSKLLADANPRRPAVMRKGLPHRADRYTGERFSEVGDDHPKASDHAPLYMDLDLL